MSVVLVWRKLDEEPARYQDAYLQADDATVLIRQKQHGGTAWTTTAVYPRGTYEHAAYEGASFAAAQQQPAGTGT